MSNRNARLHHFTVSTAIRAFSCVILLQASSCSGDIVMQIVSAYVHPCIHASVHGTSGEASSTHSQHTPSSAPENLGSGRGRGAGSPCRGCIAGTEPKVPKAPLPVLGDGVWPQSCFSSKQLSSFL